MRQARIMTWVGLVVIVTFYGASQIAYWTLCGSDLPILSYCTSSTDMEIAQVRGVFGFVSDLYIISIPLYLIPSLSITARQKLSISTVFLTSLLACIASAISMVYRFRTSAVYSHSTWWTALIYATVTFKLNIGIVCSCMPVVYVLFKEDATGIRTM
ncbi:hypothetical protein F4775DRAFT_559591 [Biscogniauxia sp. FL1348]|nr:hypothetical protein F4775DRAFT_559591 [Biscogniauxia sp. FL1348]